MSKDLATGCRFLKNKLVNKTKEGTQRMEKSDRIQTLDKRNTQLDPSPLSSCGPSMARGG